MIHTAIFKVRNIQKAFVLIPIRIFYLPLSQPCETGLISGKAGFFHKPAIMNNLLNFAENSVKRINQLRYVVFFVCVH